MSNWTIREEANALTLLAFRNGYIEELHAGKHDDALDNPDVSRITNEEMKRLMIESSERLAQLLHLRETDKDAYLNKIKFARRSCAHWDNTWPVE